MNSKKPLVTNPKYTTRLTRILCEIFPDDEDIIIRHHLNVLGARGIDQRDKMQSTFKTEEDFKLLWEQ